MAGRSVWDTPLGQARITEIRQEAETRAAVAETSAAALRSSKAQRRAARMQQRQYAAARASRLTADWNPSNSSADSELVTSLTTLRSRARALIRDVSYGKRAQLVVVNNVIGNGIGMQAQVMTSRGGLADRVNDGIEEAWADWSEAESCHTGGRLAFSMLERAAMAQVFAAGEVFLRKHYRAFGKSRIPYALELIEAERIADNYYSPYLSARNGNEIRMGVEVDEFHRPVAYHIRRRHPSEIRFNASGADDIERIPADQIIHLAVIDRWPQTRGEPWMHAVARTFNDMAGYTEAEITRARVQACTSAAIESSDDASSFSEEQQDGSVEMELEPGVVKKLNPGEKYVPGSVTAPNPALDPFMRYMLREVAAGVGVSYESLSRDYSQSNYSSSRLALLDDRDMWRFYQSWFIIDFRRRVHREWLQQAVLAGAVTGVSVEEYAVNIKKFEKVLFKPRGWTWIDPTKEVEAYKEAIKAGFTTRTDVIAATAGGQDIEDVDNVRERELRLAREKGLQFDTDPDFYMSDAAKAQAEASGAGNPPHKDESESTDSQENPAPSRVFRFPR
jgi:lambda family phage portal protein